MTCFVTVPYGTNSGYFENGIWVFPAHLPSREVHGKCGAARCSHGDVHVQILLPLFEQLLRLFFIIIIFY